MMTNLFDPPRTFTLPLSKGGDLLVGFRYMPKVNGEYAESNYPTGSSVELVIETDDDPIVAQAEIEGSLATVWVDKAVADTVKKGKLWRAVVSYSSGLDQVMANGTVTRNDGKG